jgi:hypothetical protein
VVVLLVDLQALAVEVQLAVKEMLAVQPLQVLHIQAQVVVVQAR